MNGLTNKRAARGFSLIELLVVLAIIALLLGILLPAFSKAKERVKYLVGEPGDWEIPSDSLVAFAGLVNSPPSGLRDGTPQFVEDSELGHKVAYFDGSYSLQMDPPANLTDEITVMFWAKGDASLPRRTSIFWVEGAWSGGRVAQVHLPWSNGNVYWDAGGGGCCGQRLNTGVSSSIYKGKWTFWTFTKNATTGQMKFYADGNLLASTTGKNESFGAPITMWLGSGPGGGNKWRGWMYSFAIYNKELDQATIEQFRDAKPPTPGLVDTYQNTVINKANTVGNKTTSVR